MICDHLQGGDQIPESRASFLSSPHKPSACGSCGLLDPRWRPIYGQDNYLEKNSFKSFKNTYDFILNFSFVI